MIASELKRGDIVNVVSYPHSQKHFYHNDYEEYFLNIEGKVISSNHTTFDEVIVKDFKSGKNYSLKNRIGSSGEMIITKIN